MQDKVTVEVVEENEDGSATIEVDFAGGIPNHVVSAGITFLLLKGAFEGTDEDIVRWIKRGKQEEKTDDIMRRFDEARAEREIDQMYEYYGKE